MSALTYLTLTRLKNGIRDLLRKPARLIYVVFLLALLVFAVQGSGSTYPPESYRDLREVVAMATALFLFIFLLTVWNGFSKGGTIFSLLRREPSLPLPHSPDPHAILRPPAANQHSTLAGHLSLLPIWMAS